VRIWRMSNRSVGFRTDAGVMTTVGLETGGEDVVGRLSAVATGSGVAPCDIDIGALPREAGVAVCALSTISSCGDALLDCFVRKWCIPLLDVAGTCALSDPATARTADSALALASISVIRCGLVDLGLLNASGIAGCTRPGAERFRACVGFGIAGVALFGDMPGVSCAEQKIFRLSLADVGRRARAGLG